MASEVPKFQAALAALNERRIHDAERLFREVIRTEPKHIGALNLLTVLLMSKECFAEAEPFIRQAVEIDQTSDVSFYNFGLILKRLGKPALAKVQFDRAIEINPRVPETWNNRGSTLNDLRQYEQAIADFKQAIALKPDYADAFFNKGKSFAALRRHAEAAQACEKAVAIRPDFAEAWFGRGSALAALERYDEASIAYDRAVALKPALMEQWWVYRGDLYAAANQHDLALEAYDKAFALNPALPGLEGARVFAKMRLCDWRDFSVECERLISESREGKVNPFSALTLPTASSADQLKCARIWVDERFPASARPIWNGEVYRHNKIRIGYVSADFRDHAVSHLITAIFEHHDRKQFEITAISIGPNDRSDVRDRIRSAVDYFEDCAVLSDQEVADRINRKEIDILVDLQGHTLHSRTQIFAHRAAPIQVNYLGYPGTIGADYIDYIIADEIVIPPDQRHYYSEKVIYLPHTYQATSYRAEHEMQASRRAAGLPENGFVFCNFNNSYKITPDVFDVWMRVLRAVAHSVLWLLVDSNSVTAENLRREAKQRDVSPERLIFAPRAKHMDHLTRQRLADLFLDTLPYNAHTTAADALWVGLPILTCIGSTFPGRVAASLLTCVGAPELITFTPQNYETLAIELATNPGTLAAIRRKLAENRFASPLFDSRLFTRHIEKAYEAVYTRHQAGLRPDHIYVPSLGSSDKLH